MVRTVGTTTRGIIAPIIKKGDNLIPIVVDSLLNAAAGEGFQIQDNDILGVTESILARAQGNYASINAIKKDIENKFPELVLLVQLMQILYLQYFLSM